MNKENIRSQRLNVLLKLALKGKSYPEIENVVLSWGVTQQTARSYMNSLSAVLNKSIKSNLEQSNRDEMVVGKGSDIIKINSNPTSGRSWFKL